MKRLIGLLLLAGCAHTTTVTPPPPPAISKVVFTWTGTGNPSLRPCGTGVSIPCLTGYTITDGTTVVANPPIDLLTYTLTPAPPAGMHSYGLAVNVLNADGSTSASPKALSVAVIQ